MSEISSTSKTVTMKSDEGIMTMVDVEAKLKNEFPDEIEGANDYLKMAKFAESMGHCRLSEGLYAMAKDEYTHAKFIHSALTDWEIEVAPELVEKYKELDNKIHKIFR